MYNLDAIEKATFAYLHTDQTSATWTQVENDFQKIAADPHAILYLVKTVAALGAGQTAGCETKMLANLIRDFADYVRSQPNTARDPVRAYLLFQADKVTARHHLQ